MRRVKFGIALLFTLLMIGMMPAVAFAANPHFINASANFQGTGPNLNVTFKESGLGDNVSITYIASADATATYACINGGDKHPQASNKEAVSGPVSATGTFSSGKNGTISQTLTLTPLGAGSFSCPPGQRLVLAFVSYTNVAITDTTNNVTESIPGTFSRCFVDSGLGLCP